MRIRFLALPAMLVLTAACASTMARGRVDPDVITQEQLLQNNFHSAFEAVQALHPNWLNIRPNTLTGTQEQVVWYLNANRNADGSGMDVRSITSIRHLDGVAATTRYGVGHSQGAILVSTGP